MWIQGAEASLPGICWELQWFSRPPRQRRRARGSLREREREMAVGSGQSDYQRLMNTQCAFNTCIGCFLYKVSTLPYIRALGEDRASYRPHAHRWTMEVDIFSSLSLCSDLGLYHMTNRGIWVIHGDPNQITKFSRYNAGFKVPDGRCDTSSEMPDVGQRPLSPKNRSS